MSTGVTDLATVAARRMRPVSSVPIFSKRGFIPKSVARKATVSTSTLGGTMIRTVRKLRRRLSLNRTNYCVRPRCAGRSPRIRRTYSTVGTCLGTDMACRVKLSAPIIISGAVVSR